MTANAWRANTLASAAYVLAATGTAYAQAQSFDAPASPEGREHCEGIDLQVSPSLSALWRDAAARLRDELASSGSPCVTAHLSLETAPSDAARLRVTAADGRQTERVVAHPEHLVSTALGVVAALPPDASASPDARNIQTPSPLIEQALIGPQANDEPLARESPTHLWFGVSCGARIAAPTFLGMVDIEGHGMLEVHQWLILASLRYGSSMGEALVSTDASYDEVAGGLGVGRRFPIGESQFEVVLLPSLVSANLSDADETGETDAPRVELRVGALVDWSIPTEDGWRFTVTADTDVVPRGVDRPVRSSDAEPALPVWTAGLRLGAAGRIL